MGSMYVCGISGTKKRRTKPSRSLVEANSCCAKEKGQEIAMPTSVDLAEVPVVGKHHKEELKGVHLRTADGASHWSGC